MISANYAETGKSGREFSKEHKKLWYGGAYIQRSSSTEVKLSGFAIQGSYLVCFTLWYVTYLQLK